MEQTWKVTLSRTNLRTLIDGGASTMEYRVTGNFLSDLVIVKNGGTIVLWNATCENKRYNMLIIPKESYKYITVEEE